MADQDIFSGVQEIIFNQPESAVDDGGQVVRWRRRGDVWEGLVSHEVDGMIVAEWLPAFVLTPSSSP